MSKKQIIQSLKENVFRGNLDLPDQGLVKLTWGNVSEINRDAQLIVIKPSGVAYDELTVEDMVVCDLEGVPLSGQRYKPSSDIRTHAVLYKCFSEVKSIVHTHSTEAVKWAQARRDIPSYGTTHADTFYGNIPCTRQLTQLEIESDYEAKTGDVIVETFKQRGIDPIACPAVLVYGHGPFTWGKTVAEAVQHSIVLEEVAKMALGSELLNSDLEPIDQYLLDKHYFRKHGEDAYYGQK